MKKLYLPVLYEIDKRTCWCDDEAAAALTRPAEPSVTEAARTELNQCARPSRCVVHTLRLIAPPVSSLVCAVKFRTVIAPVPSNAFSASGLDLVPPLGFSFGWNGMAQQGSVRRLELCGPQNLPIHRILRLEVFSRA